jgi:xanthine dehydrogenase molybdopterin-binding subunit B
LYYNLQFQKIPGVLKFLCAKDIPGLNNFTPLILATLEEYEEVKYEYNFEVVVFIA